MFPTKAVTRSLRFRIALAIVLVEVVMLSGLIWTNMSNFRHSYEHRLFDSADNISRQLSATVARYLFEMDVASLDEHINRVMSHDELHYVAVYDFRQRLVAVKGSAPEFDNFVPDTREHEITDGILDLERPVEGNDEQLGVVRLGFTLAIMDKTLAELRNQAIVIGVAAIVLTIIVGFVVSRQLTKDLSGVSAAAADYGAGKPAPTFPRASNTEVSSVVDALNKMVHDREATEHQMRDSEVFFRALIEKSDDIVIVANADGNVRFVGPSIRTLLGIEPTALKDQPLAELGANTPSRETLERLLDGTATTEVHEIEVRDATSSVHTIEFSWHDYRPEPAIVGFVLNGRDITERRAMEMRLRQSEKMEALGNLTGGVAHDFNNHLAVILGNLDLLDTTKDPTRSKALIADATKACLRGAELTKGLLSFSRQASLTPKTVDLNAVVRDSSSWLQRTLPANTPVETSLLAGLWNTSLDGNALENAVLNLVINARDAMPEGGRLTIETANVRIDDDYNMTRHETLAPGRYVMLAVSDTGKGISPELQDKIFEPFFTTKPVGEGSGLGLASVQGFVRQSGGTIRVYSEPGTGSTFKLYFPAVIDDASAAAEPSDTTHLETTPDARLLVVEDSEALLDMLVATLKASGYDVLTAGTGEAALALYTQQSGIDLLITDIVMPGKMMGTGLARELRSLDPELPVIFLSGYASEATVHGNGLRPDDLRLMKPVRRLNLLAAVETALKRVHKA